MVRLLQRVLAAGEVEEGLLTGESAATRWSGENDWSGLQTVNEQVHRNTPHRT